MVTRARFEKLEQHKVAFLAGLEAWPADVRALWPAPAEWSALEVLDHLVRTESEITRYARAGLRSPKRIGPRDRLGFLLVERVFLSRRKVKVPVGAPVMPCDAPEFGEVRARWDTAREELSRLLQDTQEGYDPKAGIFQHPVSGWMTLDQVLRFFSVHIVHHEFQLQRIRAKLNALPA